MQKHICLVKEKIKEEGYHYHYDYEMRRRVEMWKGSRSQGKGEK